MTALDVEALVGGIAAARRRLLGALAAEDLLEANRRLALPPVPLRVGLVTSPGSEAYRDFTGQLERSGYLFDVRFEPSRCRGPRHPPRSSPPSQGSRASSPQLVVLVRGGGAKGDLAAFDSELVARAIAGRPSRSGQASATPATARSPTRWRTRRSSPRPSAARRSWPWSPPTSKAWTAARPTARAARRGSPGRGEPGARDALGRDRPGSTREPRAIRRSSFAARETRIGDAALVAHRAESGPAGQQGPEAVRRRRPSSSPCRRSASLTDASCCSCWTRGDQLRTRLVADPRRDAARSCARRRRLRRATGWSRRSPKGARSRSSRRSPRAGRAADTPERAEADSMRSP